MKSLYKSLLKVSIIFACLFSSCKKLVSVDPPVDQLIAESVFNSDISAISAMSGLYSQMMQSSLLFCSDGLTVYPAMSSDELYNTTSGSNDEFSKNSLQASNSTIQNNIWSFGYKYIYHANSILEGIARSNALSQPTRDQLTGEAKFIRAFCHFYLVNLFGDIPLITSTDYRINSTSPRTQTNEVYVSIINDLKDAESLLTVNYPITNKIRPNKWTIKALLARVYLYLKDYEKAALLCNEIIQSGSYSLVSNLNNVFLSGSNETIFQLAPVQPTFNTWEGNLFITNSGIVPIYAITSFLLNAFEPSDARKTSWMRPHTVNSVSYLYPYKYKVKTASTITEMYIVFRLAEIYLIRAEARVYLDDLNGSKNDINLIRLRAGLSATTAITKQDIVLAIEKERQLELFAEWGHRWFDLKRTGRADVILGAVKPNDWTSTDALYPIPLLEIQRNPFLTQNAGY